MRIKLLWFRVSITYYEVRLGFVTCVFIGFMLRNRLILFSDLSSGFMLQK